MHIVRDYGGLRVINGNNTEENMFANLYGMSPDKFMAECGSDYSIDDLQNTYIVSVESKMYEPKLIEDGIYSINILDIYSPREGQRARLDYCGHIAFVDVRNEKNERIAILYKDDECFPQPFDEWYDYYINEYSCDDNGFTPTKKQIIEVIEIMIKGYCQNPQLDLNISEDNIIILQGL